jgi:hypothetical protein
MRRFDSDPRLQLFRPFEFLEQFRCGSSLDDKKRPGTRGVSPLVSGSVWLSVAFFAAIVLVVVNLL